MKAFRILSRNIRDSFKSVFRNFSLSLASISCITITLIVVALSVILSFNVNNFATLVEKDVTIVTFISNEATSDDVSKLESKIKALDNIDSVTFYSKEQALEDMKNDMENENAEDLFSYVGEENPLPDAFRLRIADIEKINPTLMEINRLDKIDSIKSPTDFINILTGLKNFIGIISMVILAALILVSLVIISNASRASVDIRKREIAIMKLVGATNSFIKIPFFVEGMFIGVLSGGIASAITCIGYNELIKVLSQDMTVWSIMSVNGFIPLNEFMWTLILGYVAAGAVISAFGTVMSTKKYLKV